MKLILNILSGGVGSRLWPMSRKNFPKPFLKLPNGFSLIQNTLLRALEIKDFDECITVTNDSLLYHSVDEYSIIKDKVKTTFILEPFGRNTAPAIISAALYAMKLYDDPDIFILTLPADHVINDSLSFKKAVNDAFDIAKNYSLVTFGIVPNSPSVNFGYIQNFKNDVISFKEKPDAVLAKKYISDENYLWNSGMFCFHVGNFVSELEKHCKDLLADIDQVTNNLKKYLIDDNECFFIQENFFKNIRNISIDYALLEKSKNIGVVPCSIGWNDIGVLDAFTNQIPTKENNNRIMGNAILKNCTNTSIVSEERLTAAIGLKNIIIIDSKDALLVLDSNSSDDVKLIYNELKKQNAKEVDNHPEVYRPWGSFYVLNEALNFKVKHIKVHPKKRLSLQKHQFRSEHWVVVRGVANVIRGDDEIILTSNQSIFISPNTPHQLINNGTELLELIEVQSGEYLGEDDIVRINDPYKR